MFNIANIKPIATRTLGRSLLLGKKYSPEILTAVGIAGVVVAGVMAARATLKLEPILEVKRDRVASSKERTELAEGSDAYLSESEHNKNVAHTYIRTSFDVIKLYGPSITLGALSITSIICAHGIMRKRNVALFAAYKTIESAYSEYRSRIQEEIGEDRERDIYYGATIEKRKNEETGEEEDVTVLGLGHSPYAKFFDQLSPQWEKNADYNLSFLRTQEMIFNEQLHAHGHVFLNDVYKALGIPITADGQQVGWVRGNKDSFIDFGIYDLSNEQKRMFVNGHERSILLDFNVDGPILHLI